MNRELLHQAFEALKSAANNECNFFFYKIAANAIQEELAKPVEPPIYVEKATTDYEDGWEEGFKAGMLAKPEQDVYTKQQNVDNSEERVQKSDDLIHEPVAYWNGKDGFIRADDAQYVSSWSDYYPEPLYAVPPRKEWVGMTDVDITGAAHDQAIYPVSILETTKSGLCLKFSEFGEWHCSDKRGDYMIINNFLMSFAKAIEEKLKGKNT